MIHNQSPSLLHRPGHFVMPAISTMVKETTKGEHSLGFSGIDDSNPQLIDFGQNLSGSTSASWGGGSLLGPHLYVR
jgi:hypothetical protein